MTRLFGDDVIVHSDHACDDGHLCERFVQTQLENSLWVLVSFACGCQMDKILGVQNLDQIRALWKKGQIYWSCPIHCTMSNCAVINIEEYEPRYPFDLPEDYWESQLQTIVPSLWRLLDKVSDA